MRIAAMAQSKCLSQVFAFFPVPLIGGKVITPRVFYAMGTLDVKCHWRKVFRIGRPRGISLAGDSASLPRSGSHPNVEKHDVRMACPRIASKGDL